MWSLLKNLLEEWWLNSFLSRWYVKALIYKRTLRLDDYAIPPTSSPTLREFMLRKYAQKTALSSEAKKGLLCPVAGILMAHNADKNEIVIGLQSHHYHRIHLPAAGFISYEDEQERSKKKISVTTLDGALISIVIHSSQHAMQTKLKDLSHRNYHLQGTEIGCIFAPRATIHLTCTKPIDNLPAVGSELSCTTLLTKTEGS